MTDISRMICVALAVTAAVFSVEACESIQTPPAVDFIIRKFGFPAEVHNVTTSDGYILGLYRIPGSSGESAEKTSNGSKPVIFLMHGLAQNAATFLLRGNESLAFLLADRGFDVWLGSARGTFPSQKHVSLSNRSNEFWDFSWHESGVYDIPAMVSYVKQTTGRQRIQYVGHSMGCTMLFVMCSLLPERCERDIQSAYLLAPVAYLRHIRGILNPVARAVVDVPEIRSMIQLLSRSPLHGHFALSSARFRSFAVPISSSRLTWRLLFLTIEAIFGFSQKGTISREEISEIVCYAADDTSIKQLIHYAQNIATGNVFRQFNYGSQKNLERYGSSSPPSYPLENVTIPLSLYLASNDYFVQKQDLQYTLSDLPNVQRLYQVQRDKFAHLDFLIAKDTRTAVYDQIVADAAEDIF